jgi:hypothetical protein
MRKFLTALVAVLAIGATTLAASSPASAWSDGWGWRGGWGWGPGPFIGGVLLGGELAAGLAAPYSPYNAYSPYYPYGPYYGSGCQRRWNGYYWVTACY